MTQADIAQALGYPQSFVSKIENAERRLDVLEYVRIAMVIGMDPCQPLKEVAELIAQTGQGGRQRGRRRSG